MSNGTWWMFWLGIFLYILVTPWVVFLCVKWGTYGWFRGKQMFDKFKRE